MYFKERQSSKIRKKKKKKKKVKNKSWLEKLATNKYNYNNNDKYEGDSDTNCNWCTWNDPQKLSIKAEELGTGERAGNNQTTALLWSARILRRVLETRGDLLLPRLW